MKRGERVPIKKDAKYKGQDVNWTESITNKFITDEEIVVYHESGFLGRKIKEFRAKKTCFYENKQDSEAHHYALVVPEGTTVEEYDDGGNTEYRINLNENMEMYYLGSMKRTGSEEYRVGNSCRVRYNYEDNTINIEEVL